MSTRRRLENLEERAKTRQPEPGPEHRARVREWMRDSLDSFAAWRRAGSPDNEEGRYLKELAEAVRRRSARIGGEGRS